eukprot:3416544-Prymnesium_polylepis.1
MATPPIIHAVVIRSCNQGDPAVRRRVSGCSRGCRLACCGSFWCHTQEEDWTQSTLPPSPPRRPCP